jgi:hypothetical protein
MLKNNDLMKGVAIGAGAAILIPVVIAALAPIVKPLALTAMKAGIRLYEKGRESIEGFGETVEDMAAEVEEEMLDEAHEAEQAIEDIQASLDKS